MLTSAIVVYENKKRGHSEFSLAIRFRPIGKSDV